MNRRTFIRSTAAAASAFMIVPCHVLGGKGRTAPSDRLNIAGIGIGGQGMWDLQELEKENIVALCDVDWDYAAKAFEKYPKAARYRDFRVMLEREKGIDAIVIATPDHSHAVARARASNTVRVSGFSQYTPLPSLIAIMLTTA
jgi:hypothetical protein